MSDRADLQSHLVRLRHLALADVHGLESRGNVRADGCVDLLCCIGEADEDCDQYAADDLYKFAPRDISIGAVT